jgi:Ca2+-binding RTX toxin-like protein
MRDKGTAPALSLPFADPDGHSPWNGHLLVISMSRPLSSSGPEENPMADNLDRLVKALQADPGLRSSLPQAEINRGVAAAEVLNAVLLRAIEATNANRDGLITPKEMEEISRAVFDRPAQWQKFILGHGNDNGTVETGFHHVQDDGGTLEFQNRNFVDTVADAIYHYGFDVTDGRYVNEDGASNETTADVAGWLNYFLNDENVVFGSNAKDEVGSGMYSDYFSRARNETFRVYDGNDSVWADLGDDKVYGGNGNDTVGGGDGRDRIFGENGADMLWGDSNNDSMFGGAGADELGGGDGSDALSGGKGDDILSGNDGKDRLSGGDGTDSLYGGNGSDRLSGDAGKDWLYLWEETEARDTLVFNAGDSGKTNATIDIVEGFKTGTDKIDLRSLGPITYEDLDFRGGGDASCYYDGRFLRIDTNGNGSTDMMVAFNWTDTLRASDVILA